MFESSYKTIDDLKNTSIEYKNLYSINGIIYYLTTEKVDLPFVNKFTNVYGWKPQVKFFNSDLELRSYVENFDSISSIKLSVLSDVLWYGNPAHALFDGLYPIYLALIKFGHKDSPFSFLAGEWVSKDAFGYKIIKLFCNGGDLLEYPNLDKNKVYHFETLVAGTGTTGNRVVNKDCKLYGETWDGMSIFKKRVLEICNRTPNKPINETLKIVVVNNKRYNNYELGVINKVIKYFSNVYNIKFIDWGKGYNSFQNQMTEIEDVDIHVTGPGTGMLYMPFLKRGAVNINLGCIEHTQTNGARPNIKIKESKAVDHIFPSYLEQAVCNGSDGISTIYYDRYTYNNIEEGPLVEIINRAVNIIKNKTILENNLNIDALIFKEYCKRVDNSDIICNHLTDLALQIEFFVNEHPYALHPTTNLELLRQIKDEFGYNRTYEIKL
jgi:hypothetical protein